MCGMYQGGHLRPEQGMPKCDSLSDFSGQARSLLQETRWHAETHQVLHHNIPGIQVAHTQGLLTERGGVRVVWQPNSTRVET